MIFTFDLSSNVKGIYNLKLQKARKMKSVRDVFTKAIVEINNLFANLEQSIVYYFLSLVVKSQTKIVIRSK